MDDEAFIREQWTPREIRWRNAILEQRWVYEVNHGSGRSSRLERWLPVESIYIPETAPS